jgi:hypothetical protein
MEVFEFVKSSVMDTSVVDVTLDCAGEERNWRRSDRKHQRVGFIAATGGLNYRWLLVKGK